MFPAFIVCSIQFKFDLKYIQSFLFFEIHLIEALAMNKKHLLWFAMFSIFSRTAVQMFLTKTSDLLSNYHASFYWLHEEIISSKLFAQYPCNSRSVYTEHKELRLKMNTDERGETEACCQWEAHLRGPDMVREVLIGCLRPRQYLIKYHQTQVKAGYFILCVETHISPYHFKKHKINPFFI